MMNCPALSSLGLCMMVLEFRSESDHKCSCFEEVESKWPQMDII